MQLNEAAAALTNPTRSTPHLSLLSSLELEEDILFRAGIPFLRRQGQLLRVCFFLQKKNALLF